MRRQQALKRTDGSQDVIELAHAQVSPWRRVENIRADVGLGRACYGTTEEGKCRQLPVWAAAAALNTHISGFRRDQLGCRTSAASQRKQYAAVTNLHLGW